MKVITEAQIDRGIYKTKERIRNAKDIEEEVSYAATLEVLERLKDFLVEIDYEEKK